MLVPSPVAFGPFLVTRRIARGGMAEIYRGKLRTTGRGGPWVAVKIMRPTGAEGDAVREQLFRRETRIARHLSHPNVVALLDAGTAEQRVFLAMEYVRGRDLSYVGRTGDDPPLPVELALYVAREAARGLGYAHRRRDERGELLEIVHRDVSPGNIMLAYDGAVKVLDFGVARIRERGGVHTATGTIRGKFAFMSPEQTRGEAVDPRSDVFSLGTVLYELLTRSNPFRARTPLETIERVQGVRPAPPSRLRGELHADVDDLLARCLAKEPERRFEDAHVLADAIDAILGDAGDALRERLSVELDRRFAAAQEAERRELADEEEALALIEVVDFAVGAAADGLDAPSLAVRDDDEAPALRSESSAPGAPVFALDDLPTMMSPSVDPAALLAAAGSSFGPARTPSARGLADVESHPDARAPEPSDALLSAMRGASRVAPRLDAPERRGALRGVVVGVFGAVALAATLASLFVDGPGPGSVPAPRPPALGARAASSTLTAARAVAGATLAASSSAAARGAPEAAARDGLPEGEAPAAVAGAVPERAAETATAAGRPTAPASTIGPAARIDPARGHAEPRALDPPAVGRQPRRGTGWLLPSVDGVVEVDGRRFRVRAQAPLEVPAGRRQVRWIEPLGRGQSLSVRAGGRRPLRPERRTRGARG
jgi:hypothetical protein